MTNNNEGISLDSSSKNVIQQNHITKNNHGIKLLKSNFNLISGNKFTANAKGIYLDRRLGNTGGSDPNTSIIVVYDCSNNTFSQNNLSENNCSVWMKSASNNTFSGNNFINNTDQIKIEDSVSDYTDNSTITTIDFPSVNFWDNGTEGNFWSNYTGVDSNGDSIGDTSHVIDKNNQDNYPLINPVVIPEFPDDKESAISNQTLTTIVVAIILATLFGIAMYRRKKIGNQ